MLPSNILPAIQFPAQGIVQADLVSVYFYVLH